MPKEHLHIALVCYRLHTFHNEQQQYELALIDTQRSLKIREKKLPYQHKLIQEVKDMPEHLKNVVQY